MTEPASIHEARSDPSTFGNHTELPQRKRSFRRSRSRSLVFTSSRHPTRAKFPRQKSRSKPTLESPSLADVRPRVSASQYQDTFSTSSKFEPTTQQSSPLNQEHRHQQQLLNGVVSDLSNSYPPASDGHSANGSPLTPEASTSQRRQCNQARCYHASNTPTTLAVDNLLVEAIAGKVAQQLQVLLPTKLATSDRQDHTDPEEQHPELFAALSRTSSQQKALGHFTRELERYVENTGAKGKLPIFTPTPTNSGATLRTISALLPYRPEFKAAGLAVTSKDQAKRHIHPTKASLMRQARDPFLGQSRKQALVAQLDGTDHLPSNNTDISFTAPNKTNKWRYALMDDASLCKSQMPAANRRPKIRCLPCVSVSEDNPSERGCFPILPKSCTHGPGHDTIREAQAAVTSPASKADREATPKSPTPQWANLAPPNIAYPEYTHSNVQNKGKSPAGLPMGHRLDWGREGPSSSFFVNPFKQQTVTGLRRPSMVLP
ncbi:hypothetical protein BGZ63DRAFT_398279 [Mariannaea sp. PMI_226]|nr:hypothetical protein BGZ63DRAFT_398279 [Mariannaea sp. PMI_226]